METLKIIVAFVAFLLTSIPALTHAQNDEAQWRKFALDAMSKGHIRDALRKLEAEAAADDKANRWNQAASLYRLASGMARRSGELQKSLTLAYKAVECAEKSQEPMLRSGAIMSVVDILRGLGKSSDAKTWILKGLENVKTIPPGVNRDGSSATFNNYMGQDALRSGQVQEAIDYFLHAIRDRESVIATNQRGRASRLIPQNMDMLVWHLQGLGSAYQKASRSAEAIKTYERALQIIEEFGLQESRAVDTYEGLARLYLDQKESDRAEQYFLKAYQYTEKRQLFVGFVSSAVQLGHLAIQRNQPSEAFDYYKNAIAKIEASRSQIQSEENRKSFLANQIAAYSGIVRASVATNKSEEAFDYSERARSRAFLDLLGTRVQLSRHEDMAQEEKNLRDRIATLNARVTGESDDGESEPANNAELRRELGAAQKTYDAFVAKLKKENQEQASLMNVEPLTVNQVQQMLDPGQTLLEYFVASEEVILWVVDKDNASSIRIAQRRGALLNRVNGFRDAISRLDDEAQLKKQARGLFNLLVQPAIPHVKGKELLIIPHDVLHYLPFQALLSPRGKYLIEDYPINYLSSASLMQFTQEKRKARGELSSVLAQGGKVLTFGNPDLNDPKMNLSFAEIEAKEIKSLYPQSAIYLEKDATEEKAKASVGNSDIIHFASHAELNEDEPLASAILLAKSGKEDGRLEVREIFGMDLKASLVVLSACETALGKLSSGDELVGLTRAFIYAGTPSVVASLWNVEDSSTAQLMASFYKNLKTMTKVEALRQAQLNLIRGNINSDLLVRRGIGGVGKLGETPSSQSQASSPEHAAPVTILTSHPYFWAPFILVGEAK